METTIIGIVYLDMLQQFLIPQLNEDDQGRIHFQQDGAPPHYLAEVHEYLNTLSPYQRIGKVVLIAWPPRSPHITPLDFLLCEFIKDQVFVSPVPANVLELRTQIIAAIAKVIPEMIRGMWQETDYRCDVCHINSGSHIEP
jgi:hypothetical protein